MSSMIAASPEQQPPVRPPGEDPDPTGVSDSDVGSSTVYYTPTLGEDRVGIKPLDVPPLPVVPPEGRVIED